MGFHSFCAPPLPATDEVRYELFRNSMPTPKARSSASITAADVARLQRSVKRCTLAVERMKRETEATLKRMQTEIDNLRSKLQN